MSSENEETVLPMSQSPEEAGSRTSSPDTQRNQRLPTLDAVGVALQSTVEDLNQDLHVDTSAIVNLANCSEAQKKIEDLLPIHFFSWKLKNVQAALIYTLLHMFVLLGQYKEILGERCNYQEYIAQLKCRVAQLEDEMNELKQEQRIAGGDKQEGLREEVLRLRRENSTLRKEQAKLQASQNELFKINDAWSRDYNSLTKRIDALTSGNWKNGSQVWTNGATSEEAHHPPSLTHTQCVVCHSLQDQVTELDRQVKEHVRQSEELKRTLEEKDRTLKQRDLMIKSLDNENQAVQLQIQEIGDLQAAVRMKEDFRKLQLQMKQKEKQYQDTTSKKLQLQQQVDKLRHAFMSIFGVANGTLTGSSRRHATTHRYDCRAQQYMSEPIPPPPTPPGLIARGDHFGSLVEKDRQRMLYDEQVTGFEHATVTPANTSLPVDAHSWPKVTKRSPRPNTLVPQTNGHQSKHRYIACPTCNVRFDIEGETGFAKLFDHVSYCGPKC